MQPGTRISLGINTIPFYLILIYSGCIAELKSVCKGFIYWLFGDLHAVITVWRFLLGLSVASSRSVLTRLYGNPANSAGFWLSWAALPGIWRVLLSHSFFPPLASQLLSGPGGQRPGLPVSSFYQAVVDPVSDAGRGLHGTRTVMSPLLRKQIIQQLLVGDLADLADEGLYQLLPSGPDKPLAAGKKWKAFNNKHRPRTHHANPKKQVPHPPKKSWNNNHYASSLGLMTEEPLCYVSLEHQVLHQAKQSHTEAQLVQALRDLVFPQLNLRSYLGCKSELDFSTIRCIIRGRPTDEALELDNSLRRAEKVGLKKKIPLSNAAGPAKSQPHGFPHPWLLPMEWED